MPLFAGISLFCLARYHFLAEGEQVYEVSKECTE